MKRIYLLSAFSALLLIGFSSCSKCQKCLKKNEAVVHVCEEYYSNHSQFEADLKAYENNGYSCRNSF